MLCEPKDQWAESDNSDKSNLAAREPPCSTDSDSNRASHEGLRRFYNHTEGTY